MRTPRSKFPPPSLCECLPFDIYPWMVLFCLCWITFGSYWVFDTPGAIQTQLTAWFGGIDKYTPAMNLNLYSVYSWPNVILAFFGGYIIDRVLGVRIGSFLFVTLILIGQIMFAVGIQFQNYVLCIIGRFVFGLGGESLTVGQNTYTARWFDGKILAFAFGIVLAFSRIGSSVNFAVTPTFAYFGVPFSVWFGTLMCLLSTVACGYVALLDWYGDARVQAKQMKEGTTRVEGDEISFKAVLDFPLSSWLIFLICMFFYISVLTFYTVASDIMQKTGQHYGTVQATFFLAIPNFVAIIASPTFGIILDKTGKALIWMMVACIMQVIAHVIFLCMSEEWIAVPPWPIMIWIGIGYSMFAASIWPLLPFIIQDKMLGTAYGTMTAIQNAGLAIFPTIIGVIQTDIKSIQGTPWVYTAPIMIFIACAGLALILTWLLMVVDLRDNDGALNSNGEVKQRQKEKINSKSIN